MEVFAHGAMCVSYSGRCLLSNYMTGRDSNRAGVLGELPRLAVEKAGGVVPVADMLHLVVRLLFQQQIAQLAHVGQAVLLAQVLHGTGNQLHDVHRRGAGGLGFFYTLHRLKSESGGTC